MNFTGKIDDKGKLILKNKEDFALHIGSLAGKEIEITVKKRINKRSEAQNRALHLFFEQLANSLNSAGFDMRKTIKKDIDICWTGYNVKEYLWRPVMEGMFGNKSTLRMKSDELDSIYDVINKAIGERTGVHVPFPSIESLLTK